MQKAMQENAAVYRTGATLKEGVQKINTVVDKFKDVGVTDRSLIWNSDLIETLELQNLLAQVCVCVCMCACVRACVRVCVCMCVVCACACACVLGRVSVCVYACMLVAGCRWIDE
jgi:hypothetical protein